MGRVKNYYHYSEEEVWNLTPSRLKLDNYMAQKAIRDTAELNANVLAMLMYGKK